MSRPPTIPDHTLLKSIGRGAYGEVWLARNVMGAFRAVKVIQRDRFESDRPYEREFAGIQRFEPVSRSSAGLVHLLHVGRNDPDAYFYYVMELADDVSPEALLASEGSQIPYSPRTLRSDFKRFGRLPTADCLRLALDLVSGLAQLHAHQLVHRDVKPGNIIFVHARAKLTDIGLVAVNGEGRTFVGTEGYIPPEGPGSPGADLYALGVVLYQASTGYAPEQFPDAPPEWFDDPTRVEALEVHEVILKACEAQRENRYQSADAMQADLALLQSGQSVRRVRALERRYRRLRPFGAIGAILLICALSVALLANYRARIAAENEARETSLRAQAQKSLARAETAEQEARQQLYTALLEQARGTAHSGELGRRVRTLDAVRRAGAISNTAALRQVVFATLALPDLRLERELAFSQDEGRAFDWSLERYAECVERGPVEIHATADRRLLFSLPAVTNAVGWVKNWSRDGNYLAIKRDVDGSGERADLEVWNLVSTQRVLHLRSDVTERAFCFHPSLPLIATSRIGGDVTIWDLETGLKTRTLEFSANVPYWLGFSPDGSRIAASYERQGSNFVAILDASTGIMQRRVPCPAAVVALAWQPHGRWIAAPDFAGNVRLIDPKTGEIRILGQHKAQAVDVDFSPDGNFLISGGWERELICWDMQTLQESFTIGINSNEAHFSSDGRRCAIYMRDRLQIYEFQSPTACRELPDELGRSVIHGAFSSNGQWLVAAGNEFMSVWDLEKAGPATIVRTGDRQAGIPFFPAQSSELYAYGRSALARWQLKPAANDGAPPELARLPLLVPAGLQCASVRSNEVVSTCVDCVRIMQLGNTNVENERRFAQGAGWGSVSPDGKWLGVKQYYSSLLRIYRLPAVEETARLTNHAEICTFAFSPRGAELAVVTSSGLEFYETTRWTRTRALPLHCERFGSVRFTPDGESFWFTSDRRISALRDTRTLEVLLPLPAGTTPLAVSPDGRRLAVSVDLRRVQLWDVAQVRDILRELDLDW